MVKPDLTTSGKAQGLPRIKGHWYARIPLDVIGDDSLLLSDLRVYAAIATGCWQGNYSSLGMRLIGQLTKLSRPTIIAAVRRIEKAGHIQRTPEEHGRRAGYILTSPVFGQKQGRIDEVLTDSKGHRRLVSVATGKAKTA